MLESLFYFAVTVLVLGSIFWTYEKVRRWRRPMRIAGWLALMTLLIVAAWWVCRAAFAYFDLVAYAKAHKIEVPWYRRVQPVGAFLLQFAFLFVAARVCVLRTIADLRQGA